MNRYDLKIKTYAIQPPLGGEQSWGAKALVWEIDSQKAQPTVLHEHWGETEDEARQKADREGRKWISEHTIENR